MGNMDNDQMNQNGQPDYNGQMNQNGQPGYNGQMNQNGQPGYNSQWNQNGQFNPGGQFNYNQTYGNPQYNQDMYMDQQAMIERDKREGNPLCWISLSCAILSRIVPAIMYTFNRDRLSNLFTGAAHYLNGIASGMYFMGLAVGPLLSIAAFILMIIARVKYPTNTFAKVLMWIYIVIIGLGVLAFVLIFFFLLAFASTCEEIGSMG